jgi:hypothetical protein
VVAGLGDYAYNELGWKNAAIIGDDYSFPYTSLAGFVAEFCAIGGQVTKRVWAPLGEKDYSSYISQLPEDVDGLYVGIGGSGLINFVKQYRQQKGEVDTKKMMGNVFWDDPLVLKEVGSSLVGGTTAAMTAGDSTDPEVAAYLKRLEDAYGKEIAGLGPSVFTYGYYTAGQALVKGLEQVKGDVSDQKKLQDALAKLELTVTRRPYGDVKLDERRQAISNIFVKKIVKDANGDGVPDVKTFRRIPDVDQTFGGFFSPDSPRSTATTRSARSPTRHRRGSGTPKRSTTGTELATSATSADRAEPILRLRGIGRRFGGVVAVSDVDLQVRPGEAPGHPGPERRRQDDAVQPDLGGVPAEHGGPSSCSGATSRRSPRAAGRGWGSPGRSRTSRLFGGLSVEDNLYLAVLGVADGHLRLVRRARDSEMREKARAMAEKVGLADRLEVLVAELSHGEQRQLEVGHGARGRARS